MEKNIVVPEGIVDAILAAPLVVASRDGRTISLTEPSAREVARRVCVALSENPIVPTPEQLRELIRERSQSPGTTEDLFLRCIDWWQRRMFLAPEPEIRTFVKQLADCYRGVTLTPQEADFIVEQLRYVTHGWNGGAK